MLIIRNPTNVFDTEEIQRGTLIYAKHKSWSKGEQGFVVSVTGNKVTVQYPPQIGNVTNHFFIYADEVANGGLGNSIQQGYADDREISGGRSRR